MNIRILLILFFATSLYSSKAQDKIERIVVYKNFLSGGTTSSIVRCFNIPTDYQIDTTNINDCNVKFVDCINRLLIASKKHRHFQKKISNINISGELWLADSEKHFFIIYSNNRLVDFTQKKEYKVTDSTICSELEHLIKCLNAESE